MPKAFCAAGQVPSNEELQNGISIGQVEQLRSLMEQQQMQIIHLQEQLLYQQKLIATMRAGGQRSAQRAEQLQGDLEKATAALQGFEERYSKVLRERDDVATTALQSFEERYNRVLKERDHMLHERDDQIAGLKRELERSELVLHKKDRTIASLLEKLAEARGIPASLLQEAVDIKHQPRDRLGESSPPPGPHHDQFFLAEPSAVSLSKHCNEQLSRKSPPQRTADLRSRSCDSAVPRRPSNAAATPDTVPRGIAPVLTAASPAFSSIVPPGRHSCRQLQDVARVLDMDDAQKSPIGRSRSSTGSSHRAASTHSVNAQRIQPIVQMAPQTQMWPGVAAAASVMKLNAPNGVLGNVRLRCLDGSNSHNKSSSTTSKAIGSTTSTAHELKGWRGGEGTSQHRGLATANGVAGATSLIQGGAHSVGPVVPGQAPLWADWRPSAENARPQLAKASSPVRSCSGGLL
eukprot:gnl/MRDRNA2_/MRDRNA2_99241_c0_seq1.p1 gnl/MRDRNA2_/MRDRNA2_99241_c0~~gnl/MRDRNA2_/MRDRNA2_99241_c0_seq1.p1  ORF type:complete len:519 (+),score=114.99 gnl/MRDRNA2_/MRDRNA2_99241_c0_seq1:173-1558(+)